MTKTQVSQGRGGDKTSEAEEQARCAAAAAAARGKAGAPDLGERGSLERTEGTRLRPATLSPCRERAGPAPAAMVRPKRTATATARDPWTQPPWSRTRTGMREPPQPCRQQPQRPSPQQCAAAGQPPHWLSSAAQPQLPTAGGKRVRGACAVNADPRSRGNVALCRTIRYVLLVPFFFSVWLWWGWGPSPSPLPFAAGPPQQQPPLPAPAADAAEKRAELRQARARSEKEGASPQAVDPRQELKICSGRFCRSGRLCASLGSCALTHAATRKRTRAIASCMFEVRFSASSAARWVAAEYADQSLYGEEGRRERRVNVVKRTL